ncbi:MAG: hypothetical protein ACI9S9_004957, partial [Planctomycetota bacterium]
VVVPGKAMSPEWRAQAAATATKAMAELREAILFITIKVWSTA